MFLSAIEVVERGDGIGGQMFLAQPVSVADVPSTIEEFAARRGGRCRRNT